LKIRPGGLFGNEKANARNNAIPSWSLVTREKVLFGNEKACCSLKKKISLKHIKNAGYNCCCYVVVCCTLLLTFITIIFLNKLKSLYSAINVAYVLLALLWYIEVLFKINKFQMLTVLRNQASNLNSRRDDSIIERQNQYLLTPKVEDPP